jgi:hypothetical protein
MNRESPSLRRQRATLKNVKAKRWIVGALIAAGCLMTAIGIYIGLHVRVLRPDW